MLDFQPSPDFGRLQKVLLREGEPDRVPFIELFHDPQIMAYCLQQECPADPVEALKWQIRFHYEHGYDYCLARYAFGFPGLQTLLADDTASLSRGQRGWQDEHHGPIETWEDFERYQWPDPAAIDYWQFEQIGALLPDGMRCTSMTPGGVLENLIMLMGLENLCIACAEDRELVKAVVDRVGAALVAIYESLVDFEWLGAMWLNDDLGFKTQTMISPKDLREFIFPWHKACVDVAHAHGKPVMLHACGNLFEVMDDIIDTCGFDARHSFEDVITPVAQFKRQWGDRIALLGGIDVDVLTRASEEECRQYVRRVIAETAPGGGWGLGSGNSVANYVNPENFLAMLDEGLKCGGYPLA
jgi:uroporphyrinogen decarboxylase